jgi:3'-phosphoadenosine 5'-phosphosulfate (PAPS) 3'-phosphatase
MNDHELARKLARETGTLLMGLRKHATSLSAGEDETHSVLAEEVLGSEGDRVAHDYLMEQFSTHRPNDVVLSEEGDLEVARQVVKISQFISRYGNPVPRMWAKSVLPALQSQLEMSFGQWMNWLRLISQRAHQYEYWYPEADRHARSLQ